MGRQRRQLADEAGDWRIDSDGYLERCDGGCASGTSGFAFAGRARGTGREPRTSGSQSEHRSALGRQGQWWFLRLARGFIRRWVETRAGAGRKGKILIRTAQGALEQPIAVRA